jgi:hypothetical protein
MEFPLTRCHQQIYYVIGGIHKSEDRSLEANDIVATLRIPPRPLSIRMKIKGEIGSPLQIIP